MIGFDMHSERDEGGMGLMSRERKIRGKVCLMMIKIRKP